MTIATDFRALVADFKARNPQPRASEQAKESAPRVQSAREYVYKPATTCSLCGDPSDRQVCARCSETYQRLGL